MKKLAKSHVATAPRGQMTALAILLLFALTSSTAAQTLAGTVTNGPTGKPAAGDQVILLDGVTTQDVVVSAGANKLKNGSLVAVNNKVALPNDANPHPKEQ